MNTDTLITELTVMSDKIASLEKEVGDYRYVLLQLKSQLLDTYAEDSLLIQIITEVLNRNV